LFQKLIIIVLNKYVAIDKPQNPLMVSHK